MSRPPPLVLALLAFLSAVASKVAAAPIAGFQLDSASSEQQRTIFFDTGARAVIHAPADFNPARPTHLLIFALPNGNTIEQTIGCAPAPGLDWHFNIQHIGAQVRLLRQVLPKTRNLVVAYLEADGLSWPSWRQKQGAKAPDNAAAIVDNIVSLIPGDRPVLSLAAHSGGGSFLFTYIDSRETIADTIERFAFLDANYSFDEAKGHANKLTKWVNASRAHHLFVLAYDDRDVMLNGKKIVSDTGGTWRASMRMIDSLRKKLELPELRKITPADNLVRRFKSADEQVEFMLLENPEKKILHTRLVELNGLVEAMTAGTPEKSHLGGVFFGARTYEKLIQQLPTVPDRRPDAPVGKALGERWLKLTPEKLTTDQRETAIAAEVLKGNFPDFLRKTKTIRLPAQIDGQPHVCEIQVSPDYLAVGADDDFLRVPLTPKTAMKIATQLGCTLPTRKMVDAIDAAAEVKLEPRPLTENREALATFIQHNQLIEDQRKDKPLGALIRGVKKDIVLTNRLAEKPEKLAIYGWRHLDGKPIQPLTTVHKSTYVDYSHGVRLISRIVKVDGTEMLIEEVLKDPKLCVLLSDEGPLGEAGFYR